MGADSKMKSKYLTVYDYGSGGVWTYIYANTPREIVDKYPKLQVLPDEPAWFTDQDRDITKSFDIEDEPDDFLSQMRSS